MRDFSVPTVNGGMLHIVVQEYDGLQIRKIPMIIIYPHVRKKNRLETFIHEVLHHLDEKKSEKKVSEEAKIIANVLWKAGYRLK